MRSVRALVVLSVLSAPLSPAPCQETWPVNTRVKLSPLEGAPPSPRLGYEGACVWDSRHRVMIRYGGHDQGGGGEQNSEIWTLDPATTTWT